MNPQKRGRSDSSSMSVTPKVKRNRTPSYNLAYDSSDLPSMSSRNSHLMFTTLICQPSPDLLGVRFLGPLWPSNQCLHILALDVEIPIIAQFPNNDSRGSVQSNNPCGTQKIVFAHNHRQKHIKNVSKAHYE